METLTVSCNGIVDIEIEENTTLLEQEDIKHTIVECVDFDNVDNIILIQDYSVSSEV